MQHNPCTSNWNIKTWPLWWSHMNEMGSQSTGNQIFSTVFRPTTKRHQSPYYWPFVEESISDQQMSLTNPQWWGKHFHVMISSCFWTHSIRTKVLSTFFMILHDLPYLILHAEWPWRKKAKIKSGLIPGSRPANERRLYKVKPSLISWERT